ncbi:hypothetical protein Tco_0547938 [Tanacetum coccineum]
MSKVVLESGVKINMRVIKKKLRGIKVRRDNKNNIRGLMVNEIWSEDPKAIKMEMARYYKALFIEGMTIKPLFCCDRIGKFSDDEAVMLEKGFLEKEVWEAICGCGGDKSPGPDGDDLVIVVGDLRVEDEMSVASIGSSDLSLVFSDPSPVGVIDDGDGCDGGEGLHHIRRAEGLSLLIDGVWRDGRALSLSGLVGAHHLNKCGEASVDVIDSMACGHKHSYVRDTKISLGHGVERQGWAPYIIWISYREWRGVRLGMGMQEYALNFVLSSVWYSGDGMSGLPSILYTLSVLRY